MDRPTGLSLQFNKYGERPDVMEAIYHLKNMTYNTHTWAPMYIIYSEY
jgi:hypothetical protein